MTVRGQMPEQSRAADRTGGPQQHPSQGSLVGPPTITPCEQQQAGGVVGPQPVHTGSPQPAQHCVKNRVGNRIRAVTSSHSSLGKLRGQTISKEASSLAGKFTFSEYKRVKQVNMWTIQK